jgi:hypothetical protein
MSLTFAEKYHGTGGYLTVTEPPFRTPLAVALVAGGVEMGYENVDINAERQTGIQLFHHILKLDFLCL